MRDIGRLALCVALAIIFVGALANIVWGQQSEHSQFHQFYATQTTDSGMGCCGDNDCWPMEARVDEQGNLQLHVVIGTRDEWVTPDPAKRYLIYQQAENLISGPNGDMPLMPIYWYTYSALVHQNVKGFLVNPMDQTDYTQVSIS